MSQSESHAAIVATVQHAVEGLSLPSESDYPFEVMLWPGIDQLTPAILLEKTNHAPDCHLELLDVHQFFTALTQEHSWYGEVERTTMQQFRSLLALLEEHLTDLQVYRVGQIEIDVYIAGRLGHESEADWLILASKLIET